MAQTVPDSGELVSTFPGRTRYPLDWECGGTYINLGVEEWQFLAQKKRVECESKIPPEWTLSVALRRSIAVAEAADLIKTCAIERSGVLTDDELKVTAEYSAVELVKSMTQRELTAQFVVTAFCKRAAVAQQLTCCLTETFFEEAVKRAEWLDEYMTKHQKPLGPLHGLPISLKDLFQVRGVATTLGFVSFLQNPPATENSALVDLLLSCGAVPYCTTNVPQTLMTADSHNNIFGRVLNPHNTGLTAGGSTGGGAALQALRGSPLGVGTDVAGSVRIPALCCGIYAFKPTVNRIPASGTVVPGRRLPGLLPAVGPLASSLADIKLFMKAVIDTNPWRFDASAYPTQWSLGAYDKKIDLVIGILAEDPLFPWQPSVARMMEAAISALVQAGHRVIRLPNSSATSVSTAANLAFPLLSLDPKELSLEHIASGGEPMVPSVELVERSRKPRETYTISDLAAMRVQQAEFSQAWRSLWLHYELDMVLGPVAQHLAVPHDTFGPPVYTLIFNLLDYPACVIPYQDTHATWDEINGGSAAGRAPYAVQIVTPRFEDERCLAFAEVVEHALLS